MSDPSNSLIYCFEICTELNVESRALLVNIRAYNDAHAAGDKVKMDTLRMALRAAIPLLTKVGMFELFPPEEWIQGDNEGRKLVGQMYLELMESA